MTRPASSSAAERLLPVRSEAELPWLQLQVRAFAELAGLPRMDVVAVALAATEAATNMLKYAGGGELRLTAETGPPAWVEFEALDRGPGIPNVPLALEDGVSEGVRVAECPRPSSRRGLGTGLGSIRRLMTDVLLRDAPGGGTLLRARKLAGR